MNLKPTPEQEAIIAAARGTKDNLLIQAYAGTGKTSTNVMVAKALNTVPIVGLAFNKKIADEMKERFPPNVNSSTLNSLGHRTFATLIGKSRLIVDKGKQYSLLKASIEDMPKFRRSDAFDEFGDILKMIDIARLAGYIPPKAPQLVPSLCSIEELFDERVPPVYKVDLINDVLRRSISSALSGTIDFTDQIYMPTMFGGAFPQYPVIIVDEAQDLSALNHFLLLRLARHGSKKPSRIIAVGDANQSIYAFRGAVTDGMAQMRERFEMTELPLSVTFRCPRAVVELAQRHAPGFTAAEGAIDGIVEYVENWTADDIGDGDAIICRNNAPILKCALQLLTRGRGVQVYGRDIGPGIIRQLTKFGQGSMPREQLLSTIDEWERLGLANVKRGSSGIIIDRAACFRVFAEQADNLDGAIAYAKYVFEATGKINMMTGHKSKGLEFDTVFHLEPHLIPAMWAEGPEEMQQEQNLRYVVTTRARKRLVHIPLAGLDRK